MSLTDMPFGFATTVLSSMTQSTGVGMNLSTVVTAEETTNYDANGSAQADVGPSDSKPDNQYTELARVLAEAFRNAPLFA
jgi:hypothetical protein